MRIFRRLDGNITYSGDDIRGLIGHPEEAQSLWKLVGLVEVGEVQDDVGNTASDQSADAKTNGNHTYKPPSINPSRARHVQNDARPDRNACMLATIDHETICTGIQLSGPSFLEMSWEGSSAQRKHK
jgi:hypothetical protein